ncbi:MAG TPA: hypothetical protein VMF03_20810 [Steroidobacteraceae bacterium]|nr:hypothetical protein [Steroidobacteraceae bacterium]
MGMHKTSRRRFLSGGALLAAPLAGATLCASAVAGAGPPPQLTHLEDQAALREVHHRWLRKVNAGERTALLETSVRRIVTDHAGAPERIEVAADRGSAVGYFDCAVELETALDRDSTLAQMAHVQGHGSVRRTERRMLKVDYVRSAGAWTIRTVAFAHT